MTAPSTGSLLGSYPALPHAYDEVRAPDGTVRDHWGYVAGALDQLGTRELDHRRRETERLLRNDGVGYRVYDESAESGGRTMPWVLDPIPLVLGSAEWGIIERGIIQRAELLNLILTDLYGPRELVRKGLLPLEVVYAHRGFLRQCDQVRLPGSHQLVNYAADLARAPSGEMWVLGDFAQSPSGAGYALENREVISQVFPSMYREAQVHRLAPFFRALRASLTALAPAGVDNPRVVVLTPGTGNETYFEHAFLARYLGYSLVEGPDLKVQDGRVWLRSLGGLEPVDVVLRRVDGWYGDPLELKSDSHLGVPGMLEVARRGGVSIVNGFGASVLENPGLLPFLPRLAEVLLGQELRLPSAQTWWCGDPVARQHVLSHLADLVIKPIARPTGRNTHYGWLLSASERDALQARIEARPHLFVAQQRVAFSSVPCLDSAGFEPRHAMLRSFAVTRDGSYVVMPGGLTRVSGSADDQIMSAQLGGVSKDTWVLASEPEKQTGFWLNRRPLSAAQDPAGSMSNRAAENLFWLGRYAERAETTVRLTRAILDRVNDFSGPTDQAGTDCVHALLGALTRLTSTYPGFTGPGAAARLAAPEPELLAIMGDASRPGSLSSSLRSMLGAANAVRDQLSNDTWLAVGTIDSDLRSLRRAIDEPAADAAAMLPVTLAAVMRSLLALAGLQGESMVRDPGWRFMDAGRRLERALQLVQLIDAAVVPVRSTAADSLLLESVLISTESIITYRRRYRSQAHIETVLDLLLLDSSNPRSFAFQLDRLTTDIAELPRDLAPRLSGEERLVLELSTRLRVIDTVELAEAAGTDRRGALSAFLATCAGQLAELSDALQAGHFSQLAPRHILVAGQPDAMGATFGTTMP